MLWIIGVFQWDICLSDFQQSKSKIERNTEFVFLLFLQPRQIFWEQKWKNTNCVYLKITLIGAIINPNTLPE